MAIYDLKANLDLKQNMNIYATCKQLDNLNLILYIYDNSVQVDLSSYTVRLKAMKADKVPLVQEHTGISISGNIITIETDEQLTTTSGKTLIELQFIDNSTGKKKATFNLVLIVIASTLADGTTISKSTYTLLEELENKMDQASNFFENIDEAITANNNLQDSIYTGNTLKTNLDNNITTGNTLNNDLETNISAGNILKPNLEGAVTSANTAKAELDISIQDANTFVSEHGDIIDLDNRVTQNTSQLNENTKDIEVIKKSRYIIDVTKDFDTEMSKALELSRSSGIEIFIPIGEYSTNTTFNIDFKSTIVMDKNATLNIGKTFLIISHSYCNIELNGTINVSTDCDVIIINENETVNDKTIIDGVYNINLIGKNEANNIIGIHINSRFWHNKINIKTKNISNPVLVEGSWQNSNIINGKLIAFNKGIIFNTNMAQGNNIYMDFEQSLNNNTTYGIFVKETSDVIKANCFTINNWLDNYNGKYYCYYDEAYSNNTDIVKFLDNKIEGEIEGLLGIDTNSNLMQTLFFTRRDRSIDNGDMVGSHNAALFTNLNVENELNLSNLYLFNDILETPIRPINSNATVELTLDEELNKKVIKVVQKNDTGGYAFYNINNNKFSGKIVTLSCFIKILSPNKNNKYTIYLNDGVNSTPSVSKIRNGVWCKVTVTMKIDSNATLLQLNLGRKNGSITNALNDEIYISDLQLIEGSSTNNHYTKSTDNVIFCYSLPKPTSIHRGKIFIKMTDENTDSIHVCLLVNNQYTWKKLSFSE